VSVIAYVRYMTESFNYGTRSYDRGRRIPASDELFEDLKAKDDQVRGKKTVRPKLAASKAGRLAKVESRPLSPLA